MSANPYRGEVALTIGGETRVMRLTLGRLAALEARLGAGSLMELIGRFEDGRFRAEDLVALIAAGLDLREGEVMEAEIAGGPAAAARAAAALLRLTFGPPEEAG